PRPRCPKPAPRLHLRPKTRGLRPHQTRAHAALRHRGGDRTYESRGPSQPLLSQRSRRRCRQRHPQRRRLQPSPRSRLAEDLFARHPTRATPDLHNSASPQTGFLTGDCLVSDGREIAALRDSDPTDDAMGYLLRPESGLPDLYPAASSSRTPPSRPRASRRSRTSACPLCGGGAAGGGAAVAASWPRWRWLRWPWRSMEATHPPLIAALAAASDLTILHPRGVPRRRGKRFFVMFITSRAQLGN